MLQEFDPLKLNNAYASRQAAPGDSLLVFRDQSVLVRGDEEIRFPSAAEGEERGLPLTYLFRIGEQSFFRAVDDGEAFPLEGGRFLQAQELRPRKPAHLVFAAVLGLQLHHWYESRRHCGRCGGQTAHDPQERALVCAACNTREYPQLMPAVIVGVISGDRLLLTRYAGRVRPNWALVAGYAEAGESLEECVAREVMEETGLTVTDISYYKSQPWPFSGSLLVGYFARVTGDDTITLDEHELSEARFIQREEIDVVFDGVALTNEMICAFRKYGAERLLYSDAVRQEPFRP